MGPMRLLPLQRPPIVSAHLGQSALPPQSWKYSCPLRPLIGFASPCVSHVRHISTFFVLSHTCTCDAILCYNKNFSDNIVSCILYTTRHLVLYSYIMYSRLIFFVIVGLSRKHALLRHFLRAHLPWSWTQRTMYVSLRPFPKITPFPNQTTHPNDTMGLTVYRSRIERDVLSHVTSALLTCHMVDSLFGQVGVVLSGGWLLSMVGEPFQGTHYLIDAGQGKEGQGKFVQYSFPITQVRC